MDEREVEEVDQFKWRVITFVEISSLYASCCLVEVTSCYTSSPKGEYFNELFGIKGILN